MRPPRDRRLGGRGVPPDGQAARRDSGARALSEPEPRVVGVYETVLYAADVAASAHFYADVLGLRLLEPPTELSAAFRLGDGGVLLLFDPDRSSVGGRPVPSHGATGAGHVALAVGPGTLDAFADVLRDKGIAIEHEISWSQGGRSVYVRDPAGNSVEVIEGEAWPLSSPDLTD